MAFSFSQTDNSETQAPQQVQFSPGGISFGSGSAAGGGGGFTQGADALPQWVKWAALGAAALGLVYLLPRLKKSGVKP